MGSQIDLLCTEGLLDSGVVDFVWSRGFRPATGEALHKAQHGWPPEDQSPGEPLPSRAVIVCFCVHFPEVLECLAKNYPGGRYIIISRDGDPSLKLGNWPDCVHHVFAIAVPRPDSRATAIPMGFHAFNGWAERLQPVKEIPRERVNRVLVSHSLDTGSVYNATHERITSIEYFRDKPWATVQPRLLNRQPGEGINGAEPWEAYTARLRQHDYLAVPIGYGVERVAQWEAMVLGTIPICIRRPEFSYFSDMPIAFVDSWTEVTEEWCDANLGIINRPMDKLKLSYWADRIREKRAEIGI